MADKVIHERYRELACAAIQAGVNEWLGSRDANEYALYKWLQECDWFDYLNLDREYFYVKILELRDKGKEKINLTTRYGKKEDSTVIQKQDI